MRFQNTREKSQGCNIALLSFLQCSMLQNRLERVRDKLNWLNKLNFTTRMQQTTVVSCFLEFIVVPPSLLNYMHTTDQATLECSQLSKTKFEAFHRSCWLKLLRIVRNSCPSAFTGSWTALDWKGFRLPSKACLVFLGQLFQMSAQQSLLLLWFVSYASLKTMHVL